MRALCSRRRSAKANARTDEIEDDDSDESKSNASVSPAVDGRKTRSRHFIKRNVTPVVVLSHPSIHSIKIQDLTLFTQTDA